MSQMKSKKFKPPLRILGFSLILGDHEPDNVTRRDAGSVSPSLRPDSDSGWGEGQGASVSYMASHPSIPLTIITITLTTPPPLASDPPASSSRASPTEPAPKARLHTSLGQRPRNRNPNATRAEGPFHHSADMFPHSSTLGSPTRGVNREADLQGSTAVGSRNWLSDFSCQESILLRNLRCGLKIYRVTGKRHTPSKLQHIGNYQKRSLPKCRGQLFQNNRIRNVYVRAFRRLIAQIARCLLRRSRWTTSGRWLWLRTLAWTRITHACKSA